jgi:hypothetical protein
MNASDWDDIVGFVSKRYPDNQYTCEDTIVMFEDLKDFDASDVWSAMNHYHEEGHSFPPNASLLLSRAIDERHKSAREDMYRGTPEARGKPLPQPEPIEWSEYVVKRFGEKLSWNDAIARIHAQMRPCNTKTCDLHYPMKVGAE